MIALSSKNRYQNPLLEVGQKIMAISKTMFQPVIENNIRDTNLLDDVEMVLPPTAADNVKIKQIYRDERVIRALVTMGKNSSIRACAHKDADEIVHVISGDVTNKTLNQLFSAYDTYKISANEPHEFVSDNGCELLISWELHD